LGRIPNEDLPQLYQSIDITILPTETYENSPTVVFESLASARPVIVSDIGGAAEAIEDGKNGLIFQAGSIDELATKLRDISKTHASMRVFCKESVRGMRGSVYIKNLFKIDR